MKPGLASFIGPFMCYVVVYCARLESIEGEMKELEMCDERDRRKQRYCRYREREIEWDEL